MASNLNVVATLETSPEWPSSVAMHCPLATSHSRAVLSSEPVATLRSSALITTLKTQPE
jgi:hypothetical protein